MAKPRNTDSKKNWTNLLCIKVQNGLTALDIQFSHDEIRAPVFGMSAEKAPRLNGILILFFQKFWEIIKFDLVKLCDDFYRGNANLERINWVDIALIPKCQTQANLSHYHPISLINSTLKIVSKVLANGLSHKIDALINITQSAFIKGWYIIDNISTAQELIFYM